MKKLYIAYLCSSLTFCVICYAIGYRNGKQSMTPKPLMVYFQRSVDGTNFYPMKPIVLKSVTVK